MACFEGLPIYPALPSKIEERVGITFEQRLANADPSLPTRELAREAKRRRAADPYKQSPDVWRQINDRLAANSCVQR